MRRGTLLGLVVVAAVGLAACGGEPERGPAADATGTGVPGPSPVWLAAFRVAADVEALDLDTRSIMEAAGPAIFAGPIACFDGFPAEHVPAPDAYVLGVIAPTRAEVDAAVERVDRDPLFVARLTVTCVD